MFGQLGKSELPIILFVVAIGVFLAGGFVTVTTNYNPSIGIPTTPTPETKKQSLQLQTIPLVTPVPQQPTLCQQGGVNDESDILAGYQPGTGQSVGATGQIKVWVTDEGSPKISEGEVVNASSGQITTPGQRSAKAPDNYLWEPALYVSVYAENGGTPHFPSTIKGNYNNHPNIDILLGDPSPSGPAIDPIPQSARKLYYTAEYIWDVNSLGLSSGTYVAEFVIHDGDENRGVGCVSITIQ